MLESIASRLIILLSIAVLCSTPQTLRSAEFDQPLESVSGTVHRRHMEVLASDEMQGREAGTAGFTAAANYVSDRFRAFGLEPLGDEGTYLKHIEFLGTKLITGSAGLSLLQGDQTLELKFPHDFVLHGSFGNASENVTARLVFVGHGIVAPDYGHDDYAGLDVLGKIVVTLSGAPPQFETDQRAFYSSGTGKRSTASRRGALGLVTIYTPVDQVRTPWSRVVSSTDRTSMRWVDDKGAAYRGFPDLIGTAILSQVGAEKLFALAGKDLASTLEHHAEGGIGSFAMGVSTTVTRRSSQRNASSTNVIGVVRGRDPLLREEYVLYTAHLDHLGMQANDAEDSIHNGAYDNAAGVATLLEIARAVGGMSEPPRRSVIFVALTAEEKGLQGSSYLAHHPPVPLDSLVANINMDMPFLGFPIADVEAFGVEHSTLLQSLRRAVALTGLRYTPDPRPELVRFIRSDQFSLVQVGVPGLNLKAGSNSTDPTIDGAALRTDFLTNHYHRPSDDLSLAYSSEGAERFVRTALLLGLIVANDNERPHWNEADFFGDKFAPK